VGRGKVGEIEYVILSQCVVVIGSATFVALSGTGAESVPAVMVGFVTKVYVAVARAESR